MLVGKTKYLELGCHQVIMANEHMKIGDSSYAKNVYFLLFFLFVVGATEMKDSTPSTLESSQTTSRDMI